MVCGSSLLRCRRPRPPRPKGGRPSLDDRAALTGIPLPKSGIPWRMLPQEMGCGSGMTRWRRLRDWQRGGPLTSLSSQVARSARSRRVDRLEPVRARHGQPGRQGRGNQVGPNPTDRGTPGSKHHLVMDRQGIPLAVLLSAANVHDSILLDEVIDRIPPVRQQCGRPRFRPGKLHADKAFNFPRGRRALRRRNVTARIARRSIENRERLGRHR